MAENKSKPASLETTVLLLSVFIVGLCTIVFELLIGSVSSYFLGDSIKQFSLTIGLTMSAMGLGTLLSRLVNNHLISWFIGVEILLGFIGGLSVPLLFAAYATADLYYPVMLLLIWAIGTLIGLEIPLLTRIMDKHYSLRLNISNVLSLDYFGALAATLLFPFCMLPFLGILKSSLITGGANVLVGVVNLWLFRDKLPKQIIPHLRGASVAVVLLLLVAIVGSARLTHIWENQMYNDRVIYSSQSAYQKIILTKRKDDLRLFLDGNLQFSSVDEYRYHESLIHIPMSLTPFHENILILGGGDGLGVRELLKYTDIKTITLVDLDPAITDLAQNQPLLKKINNNSLSDPKVTVINEDGFSFLEQNTIFFDLIIADLPDPKNPSLARLYSTDFYRLIRSRLSKYGLFVTQATSPFFATKAFWSIEKSLQAAEFKTTLPYHAHVPSFGDWGYILAGNIPLAPEKVTISVPTIFLSKNILPGLFAFSKDIRVDDIKPSSLDSPILLSYYLQGWKHWN